ncbi:MAG: potassium-transporting ATPase subunit KdpA, partial [Isosphaeraceae bacterium]
APPLHGSSRMTPQPLLERLITRYPRYCNFMGYFTHKSQPVKSVRTVLPRSPAVPPRGPPSVTAVPQRHRGPPRQGRKAETIGTLPSDSITFGILVLGTVLLIGALSFLPVLALGPIAEYLKTAAGV